MIPHHVIHATETEVRLLAPGTGYYWVVRGMALTASTAIQVEAPTALLEDEMEETWARTVAAEAGTDREDDLSYEEYRRLRLGRRRS